MLSKRQTKPQIPTTGMPKKIPNAAINGNKENTYPVMTHKSIGIEKIVTTNAVTTDA